MKCVLCKQPIPLIVDGNLRCEIKGEPHHIKCVELSKMKIFTRSNNEHNKMYQM